MDILLKILALSQFLQERQFGTLWKGLVYISNVKLMQIKLILSYTTSASDNSSVRAFSDIALGLCLTSLRIMVNKVLSWVAPSVSRVQDITIKEMFTSLFCVNSARLGSKKLCLPFLPWHVTWKPVVLRNTYRCSVWREKLELSMPILK